MPDAVTLVIQAAGFDYVGVMRAGGRALIRVNGRHVSERQIRRLAGTTGGRWRGWDLTQYQCTRRARYFAFLGDKRERVQHRAAIAELIKPYPRRG